MTGLEQYTVSVCVAGIFFAVLLGLMPEKGTATTLARHICGVFMAFIVISPLKQIELSDLTGFYEGFLWDAQTASARGEEIGLAALADGIKERAEAYILDKAQAMGAVLTVEVILSEDPVPVPVSVRMDGTVTPYTKLRLQKLLTDELGIAKENQVWTR